MLRYFLILAVTTSSALALALPKASSPSLALFNSTLLSWNAFRDPATGLYCDSIALTDNITQTDTFPCSSANRNQRYSSASTGFGLVVDTILSELGYLSRGE